MPVYICSLCGGDINEDNVLFIDKSFEQPYEDEIRYNFLMGCSRDYPLENPQNGKMFKGLYFKVTPDNIAGKDVNGFPNKLRVRIGEGLTPRELLDTPDTEDSLANSPSFEEVKPEPLQEFKYLSMRVCPHCHCSLPKRLGIVPVHNVTLLGGRASGKTVFLISLLQQLENQLSYNNLGSIELLPESFDFMQPKIKYYENNRGVPEPTSTERLFPLVFEYSYKEQVHLFSIFDIAGEGIIDRQNQTGTDYLCNHQGLAKADTLWLVLDPNQINNGAYASGLSSGPNPGSLNTAADDFWGGADDFSNHDRFTMQIGAFLNRAIASIRELRIYEHVKHVISIMTKIDLPLSQQSDLFRGNSIIPLDIGDTHHNRINTKTLRQLDGEVNRFISHSINTDAKELIKNAFVGQNGTIPEVYMTAVSAYTRQPAEPGIVFVNKYHPQASKHRIIEPFLWLLALVNAAPSDVSQPQTTDSGNGRGKRKNRREEKRKGKGKEF